MVEVNYFEKYSDNIAFITSDGKEYKYGAIYSIIKSLNLRLESKSLLFCISQNNLSSLIGYFACLINKTVPLMLDVNLNDSLLKKLIKTYNPRYIWLPNTHLNSINKGEIIFNIFDYSLVELATKNTFFLHPKLRLLLTTSGSTGSPKLVKLTYKNIFSNAKAIAQYLNINNNSKPITTLPLHYSFGLSIINSHIIKGSTILLTNYSILKKDFWSFLKKYRATSFSGVPYTFTILKKINFFSKSLPDLKIITQAGGKLNEDLHLQFAEYCNKWGKSFIVMYGQTEASPRMSYLPNKKTIEKLGSIGLPIPGGRFYLVDSHKKEIKKTDKRGELVYKGDNVSMGYALSGKDLAKKDQNKSLLYTGDIARKDQDGYFYIIGRKKRFIKLFGNRINLDEVENLLRKSNIDCACTGKDEKMIIYTSNKSLIENIKTEISNLIKINKISYKIRVIKNIPKNTSGKIMYSLLEQS